MRPNRALALCMIALASCKGSPAQHPKSSAETVRYRLLIRENPVSPSDAAHCFVGCQTAPSPAAYLQCLSACPGFEVTPGEYCSKTEVLPETACLTARKIPANSEPPPGMVVLAIMGEVALVVGAASLCSISSTQCGMQLPPPQ